MGAGVLSGGGGGVKRTGHQLTTHLILVPRSRMSGAILLVTPYTSSNPFPSGCLGLWTEVKEGVEYGVGVTLEVGIHRFPLGVGVRWKE